jgi:hypothetical protein
MASLLLLPASAVPAVALSSSTASWPTFLPPPEEFSPAESRAIEHAWRTPTLHRSVEGPPAPMRLPSYLELVDTPDVTAAAARHLGLARYEVDVITPDWYRANDHDGAHGVYHVLDRRDGRRVTLSWGQRSGQWLGTVSGSALTIMHFDADGDRTRQRLETYVVIDQAVLARLARALVSVFGHVADRKLTEGFDVSSKVAAWATEHPEEFCPWLAAQPLDESRRARLVTALRECTTRERQSAPVARRFTRALDVERGLPLSPLAPSRGVT